MALINALDQSASHENGGWAASHHMPLDESQQNFSQTQQNFPQTQQNFPQPQPTVKRSRKKKAEEGDSGAGDSTTPEGTPTKKRQRKLTPKEIEKRQQSAHNRELREKEKAKKQEEMQKRKEQKEIEKKERLEMRRIEKEHERERKQIEREALKEEREKQKMLLKQQKQYEKQMERQNKLQHASQQQFQQQVVYYDQSGQPYQENQEYLMYDGQQQFNEYEDEEEEEVEEEEEEYDEEEEEEEYEVDEGEYPLEGFVEGDPRYQQYQHLDEEDYGEEEEDEYEDEEEYDEELGEEEMEGEMTSLQQLQQYGADDGDEMEEEEEEEIGDEEEEEYEEEEGESPLPQTIQRPIINQANLQNIINEETNKLSQKGVKEENIQYVLIRKKGGESTRTVLSQEQFNAIQSSGRKHTVSVDPNKGSGEPQSVSPAITGGGNVHKSAPTVPRPLPTTPTHTSTANPLQAGGVTTTRVATPTQRPQTIVSARPGIASRMGAGMSARQVVRAANANAPAVHMISATPANNRTPTIIGNRVFHHVTTTSVSQTPIQITSTPPRQTLAGGSVVLCPNCGNKNKQFDHCDSCGKPIPATSKIVQTEPINPRNFYGADSTLGSPVFDRTKVINTYSNVRNKRTAGGGTRRQARAAAAANTEPEVVTINSSEDEEEQSQPTSVTLNVSVDGSSENRCVVTTPQSSQNSRVSQPTSSQSPTTPQPPPQKSVSFEASIVYIGTLRGKPFKPLHLSRDAMRIDMESSTDDTVELEVPMDVIKQCDICPDPDMPAVHLLVSAQFAESVRSEYNMNDPQKRYFDPDSPMSKHRFIFMLIQKNSPETYARMLQILQDVNIARACIDESNRVTKFLNHLTPQDSHRKLVGMFGSSHNIVKEMANVLSQKQDYSQHVSGPDERTSRSSVGSIVSSVVSSVMQPLRTVTRLVSPLVAGGTVLKMGPGTHVVQLVQQQAGGEDEDEDRVPSPPLRPAYTGPVVKLFTYPPPPCTGAITVSTEDLFCLTEGEFLNDVIIDFYLKYLVNTVLSEEQRSRTHVFSSFFYRRLTTRPAKRSAEDASLPLAKKRHNRVRTWTRHVDIFSKDFIVVPINESAHWFLAIVCFPSLREPEYDFVTVPIPAKVPAKTRTETKSETESETSQNETSEEKEPGASTEGDIEPEENAQKEEDMEETKEEEEEKETKGEEESEEPKQEDTEKDEKDMPSPKRRKREPKVEPVKQVKVKENVKKKKGKTKDGEGDEKSEEGKEDEEGKKKEDNVEEEKMETEEAKTEAVPESQNAQVQPDLESRVEVSAQCAPTEEESGEESNDSNNRETPDPVPQTTTTDGKHFLRRITTKQPCILVMDSLAGSRGTTLRVIRDYLQMEWEARKQEKNGARLFSKDFVKGSTVKVPQQNNFSDCGLYVLQYVEQFFKEPLKDYTIPLHLEHWFPQEVCDNKRQEIRQLLFDLQKKYNPTLELQLNTT